jgi:hypothetical protein
VLCLLPLLSPFQLVDVFKAIGAAPGLGKLAATGRALLVVVTLTCLIAWLPGPSKAMAGALAWILIASALVLSLLSLLGAPDIAAMVKTGLFTSIYAPLANMAWLAMAGYGLATTLGKSLERPS